MNDDMARNCLRCGHPKFAHKNMGGSYYYQCNVPLCHCDQFDDGSGDDFYLCNRCGLIFHGLLELEEHDCDEGIDYRMGTECE